MQLMGVPGSRTQPTGDIAGGQEASKFSEMSTKLNCGSGACRPTSVVFIVTLVILTTLYETITITKNVIFEGGSLVFSERTLCLSSPIVSNYENASSPLSCTCSASQSAAPPVHDEATTGLDPLPYVTLEEAYFERMRMVDVSQIREKVKPDDAGSFKSRFLPNNNYKEFPLLAMENVCLDPTGALIIINTNPDEIAANVSGSQSIPELYFVWQEIYNCHGNVSTDDCVGVTFSDRLPELHSYVAGNTAHLLPYASNAMHNWAERTWPFAMAASPPITSTVPYPINHYIIHRFDKWFQDASHGRQAVAQMLWQFRMLMEISGSKSPGYLQVTNQTQPVCFERMLLQMHSRDRIDETRLPVDIAGPAVRKYADAVIEFFKIPTPELSRPPRKLRVVYYGRNDTSRRRVLNSPEVVQFLESFQRPPLEVFFLDEMLATGQTNYSFPEVVRLFTQTDILIIAHGANTWATFLLPEGAGVVEIIGPCNWSSYNYTDLSNVHTWMHVNAAARRLKHDLSNPFGEAIPNPNRGNTTRCLDPFSGCPDYTLDITKLRKIIDSFGYPDRPGDRFTQHWLYDWNAINSSSATTEQ